MIIIESLQATQVLPAVKLLWTKGLHTYVTKERHLTRRDADIEPTNWVQ